MMGEILGDREEERKEGKDGKELVQRTVSRNFTVKRRTVARGEHWVKKVSFPVIPSSHLPSFLFYVLSF